MTVNKCCVDVSLSCEPKTAIEAYDMLVSSLSAEIEAKQLVVNELRNKDIKAKFLQLWRPGITNVNIHDVVRI